MTNKAKILVTPTIYGDFFTVDKFNVIVLGTGKSMAFKIITKGQTENNFHPDMVSLCRMNDDVYFIDNKIDFIIYNCSKEELYLDEVVDAKEVNVETFLEYSHDSFLLNTESIAYKKRCYDLRFGHEGNPKMTKNEIYNEIDWSNSVFSVFKNIVMDSDVRLYIVPYMKEFNQKVEILASFFGKSN